MALNLTSKAIARTLCCSTSKAIARTLCCSALINRIVRLTGVIDDITTSVQVSANTVTWAFNAQSSNAWITVRTKLADYSNMTLGDMGQIGTLYDLSFKIINQ